MFWVIRIHVLWHDVLRLTLWSDKRHVSESRVHTPPDIVELLHEMPKHG